MASTPRRGSIVVLSALQYMPPIADNNFVNVAKMYNVYSSEQKFDPHTTASIHDTKNQRHPFVPYSLSNDNLHSLSSEDLHTSTDVPFPSITANSGKRYLKKNVKNVLRRATNFEEALLVNGICVLFSCLSSIRYLHSSSVGERVTVFSPIADAKGTLAGIVFGSPFSSN